MKKNIKISQKNLKFDLLNLQNELLQTIHPKSIILEIMHKIY